MQKIKTNNLRNYQEIIISNIEQLINMDIKSEKAQNFFQHMIYNITLNYFDSLNDIKFDCVNTMILDNNKKLKDEIKDKLHKLSENFSSLNENDIKIESISIQKNIEIFDFKFKKMIELNNSNIDQLEQYNVKLNTENFNKDLYSFGNTISHSVLKNKLLEYVDQFDIYKENLLNTLKKEKRYFIDDNMQENFQQLRIFIEELNKSKSIIVQDINSLHYTYANPDHLRILSSDFESYTKQIIDTTLQDKIENTIDNFQQKNIFEHLFNKKSPFITQQRNKPKF